MGYQKTEDVPISLNSEENHSVVQRVIARQMLRIHGDKAHMMVLMEMNDDNSKVKNDHWREILRLMDELTQGEKE
jgi:hypothetical protein